MYKSLLFAIFLVICLCCVFAAPANDILDAETAIEKIIAEYERFPGNSKHHPVEVATLVDPNNVVLNLYRL